MTRTYWFFATLSWIVGRLAFRFKILHRERIIEEGPLILAVNHSSFCDPPLAGICSHRDVYYLARKSLLEWPVLGRFFLDMNVIPVDRDGTDMSALREVIKKVREGKGVVLFPEGTRTKDGNLQPARAGIGLVIAKTGAPVQPMRIFGAFDAFPKGSKMPRFVPITVVVGEPIHFTAEEIGSGGRETYQKLSDRVMEAIAAIRLE